MIKFIRGYYRLCLCGLVLGLGGTLVITSSKLPFTIRGQGLNFWILHFIVRLLLLILRVNVTCPAPEKLKQHQGFFFPNHVSYLDVLVLVAITPTRFLAKNDVRSMPVVGQIAQAIGCVFVKRGDKASRQEARAKLAQIDPHPPVTLFPEGKRGPGDQLLPFRYGAFEIVTDGNAPFLPCAIVYDRLEIAIWHRGESILKALWRLASRSGPLQATVLPQSVITPTPEDDPVALAQSTQAQLATLLEQAPESLARPSPNG